MCQCPSIVIVRNSRSSYERIEYKRTRYRLGLPTDKHYVYVKQKEFSIDEDIAREALCRKDLYKSGITKGDCLFIESYIEERLSGALDKYKHLSRESLNALLFTPIVLKSAKHRGSVAMLVPCGKCDECVKQYVRRISWLMDKDIQFTPNRCLYFLTLTYRPSDLPVDTDVSKLDPLDTNIECVYEYGSCVPKTRMAELPQGFSHCDSGFLSRPDISRFMKRLRVTLKRWYDVDEVKCAYCGEYGKKHARPHYHVCLWFSHTNKSYFGYKKDVFQDRHLRGKHTMFAKFIRESGIVPRLSQTFFKQLVFSLWNKCEWQSLDVEQARSSQALARYFTKYLLKQKGQCLPPQLADEYAPNAVPMFFCRSCNLAHNWASQMYDSEAARDGFETCYCKNKHGEVYNYKVSLPHDLLDYVDSIRKEQDLPDLRNKRRERILNRVYSSYNLDYVPEETLIDIEHDLSAEYGAFMDTSKKYPSLREYLHLTGQSIPEMVMNDPQASLLYKIADSKEKQPLFLNTLITDYNDEKRNL